MISKFFITLLQHIMDVVAAVIHLGDINFKRDDEEEDKIIITKQDSLNHVAKVRIVCLIVEDLIRCLSAA